MLLFSKLLLEGLPEMSKAYSLDLREKAVFLVDQGEKVWKVAELLSISENTLRNWLCLRKETGSLSPKQGYQRGHSHKIVELDVFRKFVESNSGDTLETLARKLGNVSDTTVGRMMKKIGYTRKKRHLVTKSGMRTND
jgi:transposase